VGSNAYVLLAIAHYTALTGETKYVPMAMDVVDWLEDMQDPTFNFMRFGQPGIELNVSFSNIVSTEQNLSTLSALKVLEDLLVQIGAAVEDVNQVDDFGERLEEGIVTHLINRDESRFKVGGSIDSQGVFNADPRYFSDVFALAVMQQWNIELPFDKESIIADAENLFGIFYEIQGYSAGELRAGLHYEWMGWISMAKFSLNLLSDWEKDVKAISTQVIEDIDGGALLPSAPFAFNDGLTEWTGPEYPAIAPTAVYSLTVNGVEVFKLPTDEAMIESSLGVQSQEEIKSRIDMYQPKRVLYIKKPTLFFMITSYDRKDIPEVIRNHIGEKSRTKYSPEQLRKRIRPGNFVALQFDGLEKDFYLLTRDEFRKQGYQIISAEQFNASEEIQTLLQDSKYQFISGKKKDSVPLIKMSDLGYSIEETIAIESPFGEQTKPSGQEAYLGYGAAPEQWYMVNEDQEGLPADYTKDAAMAGRPQGLGTLFIQPFEMKSFDFFILRKFSQMENNPLLRNREEFEQKFREFSRLYPEKEDPFRDVQKTLFREFGYDFHNIKNRDLFDSRSTPYDNDTQAYKRDVFEIALENYKYKVYFRVIGHTVVLLDIREPLNPANLRPGVSTRFREFLEGVRDFQTLDNFGELLRVAQDVSAEDSSAFIFADRAMRAEDLSARELRIIAQEELEGIDDKIKIMQKAILLLKSIKFSDFNQRSTEISEAIDNVVRVVGEIQMSRFSQVDQTWSQEKKVMDKTLRHYVNNYLSFSGYIQLIGRFAESQEDVDEYLSDAEKYLDRFERMVTAAKSLQEGDFEIGGPGPPNTINLAKLIGEDTEDAAMRAEGLEEDVNLGVMEVVAKEAVAAIAEMWAQANRSFTEIKLERADGEENFDQKIGDFRGYASALKSRFEFWPVDQESLEGRIIIFTLNHYLRIYLNDVQFSLRDINAQSSDEEFGSLYGIAQEGIYKIDQMFSILQSLDELIDMEGVAFLEIEPYKYVFDMDRLIAAHGGLYDSAMEAETDAAMTAEELGLDESKMIDYLKELEGETSEIIVRLNRGIFALKRAKGEGNRFYLRAEESLREDLSLDDGSFISQNISELGIDRELIIVQNTLQQIFLFVAFDIEDRLQRIDFTTEQNRFENHIIQMKKAIDDLEEIFNKLPNRADINIIQTYTMEYIDTSDLAMRAALEDVGDEAMMPETVGGIDFNPDLLDLQIRRDVNGTPLPLPQQPIHNINIDGFIPVIINISPVPSIPLLMGQPFEDAETVPVDTARNDPYIREEISYLP